MLEELSPPRIAKGCPRFIQQDAREVDPQSWKHRKLMKMAPQERRKYDNVVLAKRKKEEKKKRGWY